MDDASGPNHITVLAVGLGACLILINAAISFSLSLGLELQLIIASVRCIVQLTILGFILVPIFTTPYWYVVVLYALLMGIVGAWEATSRPTHTYKGMFMQVLSCTVVTSGVFVGYALVVLIRTNPWWQPQYLIPLLGMLLGNCISGMSVGLSALVNDLLQEKDKLELLLCLGATRWEAGRECIARCLTLALTPILNQMSVVGIVSIPGMMTGQILGGTNPAQAARYQMLVMFLIATTTGTGTLLAVYAAYASIVDDEHRLRLERLTPRSSNRQLNLMLQEWATQAGKFLSGFVRNKSKLARSGSAKVEAPHERRSLMGDVV